MGEGEAALANGPARSGSRGRRGRSIEVGGDVSREPTFVCFSLEAAFNRMFSALFDLRRGKNTERAMDSLSWFLSVQPRVGMPRHVVPQLSGRGPPRPAECTPLPSRPPSP